MCVQITVKQNVPWVDFKVEYEDWADSSLSICLFARAMEAKGTQHVDIHVMFCGDGKTECMAAFV